MGKMCVPQTVGQWLLEVDGWCLVKSLVKWMLRQKSPLGCYGHPQLVWKMLTCKEMLLLSVFKVFLDSCVCTANYIYSLFSSVIQLWCVVDISIN